MPTWVRLMGVPAPGAELGCGVICRVDQPRPERDGRLRTSGRCDEEGCTRPLPPSAQGQGVGGVDDTVLTC